MELEWWHQGEHWLDERNDEDGDASDRDTYGGHDLFNLRADFYLTEQVRLYTRVLNLTDKLYAETTSKWGPTYTPGRPCSAYLGVSVEF